ncbi:MAG: hypothetical protein HY791_35760 [Deltaproteobacteria bacterium]|nr:hypothetical protein [Deltaproteobacteria bacterium]
MTKLGGIRITDIHNQAIRKDAVKLDADGDGVLRPAEAEKKSKDFFQKAANVGQTGGNAGWAAGLTTAFAHALPSIADSAAKFAALGGMWGAVFQAVGSGSRNLEAMRAGRMTGGEALVDTVEDVAIAGASGAVGAAIGAAVGSVVPVIGPILGIIIGATAGYMMDRAAHSWIDRDVKAPAGSKATEATG